MSATVAPSPADPLAAGLHYSLPMADYVADPCERPSLSASTIRKISDRSPLHAWQWHPRFGGRSDYSRKADLGSAAHAVLLEGPAAVQVVEGYDNYRTNAAKAMRAEIYAAGKIPVFTHEAVIIYQMAKIADAALRDRVGEGVAEATAIWREQNGVWGRARPDFLAESAIVNYKTSKTAEAGEWERRVLFKTGHDISAAWYLRGLEQLGQPRDEYLFLVQETEPPFDYSWIGAGPAVLDLANRRIHKAIKLWGECLESDEWPGYPKHTNWPDPPAYLEIQLEEQELAADAAERFAGEPLQSEKERLLDGL